ALPPPPELSHALRSLLQSAADRGDTALLVPLLSRLQRLDASPSPADIVRVVRCFARCEDLGRAEAMADWMRRTPEVGPSLAGYAALLALPEGALQRRPGDETRRLGAERLKVAERAYRCLLEDGIAPDAHFFAAYLDVCAL
ncbi:hypothetical protein H632_c4476p0, partial [Helicosporidium sp. ATCC 50920]